MNSLRTSNMCFRFSIYVVFLFTSPVIPVRLSGCFVCGFQRLRGTAESLYVLAKAYEARFEFIFTNLVRIFSALVNYCKQVIVVYYSGDYSIFCVGSVACFIYSSCTVHGHKRFTKMAAVHRRSQDFVCGGALFFTKKSLAMAGGALRVLRGCTYTFFL